MSFSNKSRVTAVCALAMALFASVGWRVAQPADPQGALTLLVDGRAWPAALLSSIALAAVASAVATAVVGPAMAEAGLMAAALGLAMMSTRGGTMTQLLMYHGNGAAARRTLATLLMIETVLWFAALVAAWLVAGVVRSWVDDRIAGSRTANAPRTRWARLREAAVHLRDGVLGMVICAVVAAMFIRMTIARTPVSAIDRGQVFFAVGVGFFLGAALGPQFWPRGATCWYTLSILIVALAGYAWGFVAPEPSGLPVPYTYLARLATTPPNDLFRVLPVEYVGVGVAGAVWGHGFGLRMYHSRKLQGSGS